MDSKKYNNIKLGISIFNGLLSFALLFLLVSSNLSREIVELWSNYFTNSYIILLLFIFSVGIAFSIIFSPLNYYSNFYLEHKYNLSNQTFIKWIWEGSKALFVSLVIGIPILLFLFYSLNRYENFWWLPFAILLFLVSVVLARIIPTIILPLFYKIIPIENEELKLRINKLAVNAGIKVENVYSFDMSKNTKKANAAFTGLGKSKRIILGDTLLNNFSLDEIETVIAHELGHYKKKHILKNIIIGTVSSFLTLFLISLLYDNTLGLFGFKDRSAIAAFPLISIWAMIIGLIQLPFTNMISRKFEYEADNYSILVTKKPQVFADALNKLNKQNLGDENPHPLVEWYFNSHPSVSRRIKKIELSL
ncbi:MAG: peptidase [Ignavibacteriales bacterium CG_4_9_14_3_um_filter_30_11]|nr:MAG: peptidase [Ignavibacteriales bacterium CG_4_9_14_3_um_filter_30_11]